MRILLLALLMFSNVAFAETYKLWHFTSTVHIVLTNTACQAPNSGKQAKAVRNDGAVINGCYVIENKTMAKITWANNDFALLELKNFGDIQESVYNQTYR